MVKLVTPPIDWEPRGFTEIMREQALVYVQARKGLIDPGDLGKYTHALMSLSKTMKDKLDSEQSHDNGNTLADFVQAMQDSQLG